MEEFMKIPFKVKGNFSTIAAISENSALPLVLRFGIAE
jgi:hypothetical protein